MYSKFATALAMTFKMFLISQLISLVCLINEHLTISVSLVSTEHFFEISSFIDLTLVS